MVPSSVEVGIARPDGTARTIATGDGLQRVDLSGTTLTVLTHRPTDCQPRLLMLVLHGVERDPGPYRAHARLLADPLCALVVAPEFDQARFPRDDYQYGGVPGVALGERSIDLVVPLVARARGALGAPDQRKRCSEALADVTTVLRPVSAPSTTA